MQRLPFFMVVMLLNRHYTYTLTILIFRFLFPIPRLRLDIGVIPAILDFHLANGNSYLSL